MTIKQIAAELVKHQSDVGDVPHILKTNGWTFGLTKDFYGMIFSACLFPKGRSSTAYDWRFLGAVCAEVGMPPEAMENITRQQLKNPNAVLTTVYQVQAPAGEA